MFVRVEPRQLSACSSTRQAERRQFTRGPEEPGVIRPALESIPEALALSLARQQTDFTSEGAPPPRELVSSDPATPEQTTRTMPPAPALAWDCCQDRPLGHPVTISRIPGR